MSKTMNANEFEVIDAPAPLPTSISTDSALRSSVAQKKDNSYYYAHTRDYEIPADAKVIRGPGLITGGFPELIESTESPVKVVARAPATGLTKFSWADEGNKVKIYIFKENIPESDIELSSNSVTCEFTDRSVVCDVQGKSGLFRFKTERLFSEIDVSKCTFKATSSKLLISLTKQNESSKWTALQK